jgi:hypothetical protein
MERRIEKKNNSKFSKIPQDNFSSDSIFYFYINFLFSKKQSIIRSRAIRTFYKSILETTQKIREFSFVEYRCFYSASARLIEDYLES